MRRAMLLSALWCLALPAVLTAGQSVAGVKAEPWEKFLGKWKQVPGPDEPTMYKIEPEGRGVKISFGCKQDGACTTSITTNYDGNRSKSSAYPGWEASVRKTDDRILQEDGYYDGKLRYTDTWRLSSDGEMLMLTSHSVSPPGSKDIVYAHHRSGGPVSKDDPFVGFWKRDWNKSDALITAFSFKGVVFTITSPEGITIERDCDGKDHPEAFDTTAVYSCRFADSHTYEMEQNEDGRVIFSLTRKISDDGKKMVVIRKNAEGETLPEWTFEKIK